MVQTEKNNIDSLLSLNLTTLILLTKNNNNNNNKAITIG